MGLVYLLLLLSLNCVHGGGIPTTLEGPFKPVTAPLDKSFSGNVTDLPDVPSNVEGFQPQQIFVSLSNNYDSVWISWITGEFQIGYDIQPLDPEWVQSIVQFRVLRSQVTYQAKGYSLVYSQIYPYDDLQKYTSGIIHHVLLTGLEPNTLYEYECGDPSISVMSDSHYFRTMPVSNASSYPSRIAVVGDLGLTYNTTTTVSHLLSNHPALLLLIGDLSYADLYFTNGTNSFLQNPFRETYQPRWDYWGRFMQPLVSNVPTMVIEGEHEIEQQADNYAFVAYSYRFAFPYKEGGSSSALYYSFNSGGIHFVMLGAFVNYDKSSDQYNWLERDLAEVDRKVTPWLVAAWHRPWYSTYVAQYREAECMRVEMEELLYHSGVDIVFNGHVHAYERSNRVYNYSLDPCGPVYITVGDGGNVEGLDVEHADEPGNCPDPASTADKYLGGFCAFNFTSGPASGKFCWDQQPDYSAYRESSFGHGILEVKNETHALWTWHRNQEYYENAGDIIYIVREPNRCPVSPK
ncbi:purple acid phosphatase 15-like [Pistacia vera]|uniref:purple acid phosphatase 15-like n=1 Tax=Pistacia vera TaxID=55513 RepID=UPI00126339CD|nr:purple acid phosphatase 15-like [Pistacia vera]XP_031263914.1 purple acid phosphatase 15-like [Pistacia vera]